MSTMSEDVIKVLERKGKATVVHLLSQVSSSRKSMAVTLRNLESKNIIRRVKKGEAYEGMLSTTEWELVK